MLVSVVVPAYNADKTLHETLESVAAQTHRNIEAIVVDDGSTDRTAEIARAFSEKDLRFRVVSTANSGVASARNFGVSLSNGCFVAPIDADDLWHPEKIERQLYCALQRPDVGFVYCYFRRINADGRVIKSSSRLDFEGCVFLRSLHVNLAGNGSSPLFRREAIDQVGGYDPRLRERNAQGCEDWLLQILIARTWKVACVPLYLTGYRDTPGAMSKDLEQMARSALEMYSELGRLSSPPGEVAVAAAAFRAKVAADYACDGRLRPAFTHLSSALQESSSIALDRFTATIWRTIVRSSSRNHVRLRRRLGRPALARSGPHFYELASDQAPGPPAKHSEHIRRLSAFEAEVWHAQSRLAMPQVVPAGQSVLAASQVGGAPCARP
jgi:hypothetical protein